MSFSHLACTDCVKSHKRGKSVIYGLVHIVKIDNWLLTKSIIETNMALSTRA